MNATATCSVCGTAYETWAAWLRKVKQPTCSRRCSGKLRYAAMLPKVKHTGQRQWTPETRARWQERMAGDRNPSWKGGVTYKRPKGNYIGPRYIRCPAGLRVMARTDGYVMEHRLVMAQWIGRPLTRTEVVNHVNHNPRDNRRENLDLWPTNADHKRGEVGRFVEGVANRV